MSFADSLRKWFRLPRGSSSTVGPRRRPRFEALEDRCLPATGPVAFVPAAAAWHIRHDPSAGGATITPFAFGGPTLTPLAGDWNGDGTDTVGAFDPATATFYLRDANSPGGARAFAYGAPGWLPVVGDWNGDGVDTVGVVDPLTMTWYLRNSNSAGAPDVAAFAYGAPGWVPVVGDWNGDGRDGVGVYDPATATFYLGAAGVSPFAYGAPGWTPVVGDWNGDGAETVGVVSGEGVWYLRNSNSGGAPDVAPFAYGGPGIVPLAMNTAPAPRETVTAVVNEMPPARQPSAPAPQAPTGPVQTPVPQAPALQLAVPSSAAGTEFTATLTLTGMPATSLTSITLDIDLNHNGVFESTELGWAVGFTPSSDGPMSLTARGLIHGTYNVRAQAFHAGGSLASEVKQVTLTRPASAYLPLAFEPNLGQTDAQVQFLARSSDFVAFLTGQGLVLSGRAYNPNDPSAPPVDVVQRMLWFGANANPQAQGEQGLEGRSNYYLGNDPSKWVTDVPNYAQVRYTNVWDSVDVVFKAEGGHLRWDFEVAPGGRGASRIALSFPDAQRVEVDAEGRLVLHTPHGLVVQSAPVAYQETDAGGTVAVRSMWVASGGNAATLVFDKADPSRRTIIDPYVFNTFFGGGTGFGFGSGNDAGNDIAVNSSGEVHVTGRSRSTTFPTNNAFDSTHNGGDDVVVVKLNSAANGRIFSTYLGGGNNDVGNGIALDSSGNIYVAGATDSNNFPTTSGSFGPNNRQQEDAFLTRLTSTGTMSYSGYLGGNNEDRAYAVVVDSAGNAYVVGETESNNLGTSGVLQTTRAGQLDAFVTRISSDGSSVDWFTYLGGNNNDRGRDIAIDANGDLYIVGRTNSTNFTTRSPVSGVNPLQTSRDGPEDGFVTKISSDGTAIIYSTYLGGGRTDRISSVAVDGSGNAYVTGVTDSNDFYVVSALAGTNALQTTRRGGDDAFVTKLNSTGTAIVYSTYLGGNQDDGGNAIAVDEFGLAYVVGYTNSANFPNLNALQNPNSANFTTDAFVSVVNATGTALVFSTNIGGGSNPFGDDDFGNGVALDSSRNIYIVGTTNSGSSFPTVNALQTSNAGGDDMFIAKIAPLTPPTPPTPIPTPIPGPGDGGTGGPAPGAGVIDVFESNDTSEAASGIGAISGFLGYQELTIARTPAGNYDQDWYAVAVAFDGTFHVSLTNILANGDLHLRVFTESGGSLTEVGSSTLLNSTAQGVSVGAAAGQTFYVWVFGYNFAEGFYDLAFNLT